MGIPRALLYYYDADLWISFFKYLGVKTIISDVTNKKMIEDGSKFCNSESCLSLKIFLGHVISLKDKCDCILVPRLYSICKNEGVCTNFNALYDLVNNVFDINILSYNIDLNTKNYRLLGFLKMGEILGFSYIRSYQAYKDSVRISNSKRIKNEKKQIKALENDNFKILVAGHPYNLYDNLVGKEVIDFLKKENVTVIYSNRIDHTLIDEECKTLSTDIHWTHSKEVVASVNHYKDLVDGIILISAFPCGPDSLSNELIVRKVKNVPILTLIFEDLNSDEAVITRLESFIDIIKNLRSDKYEKDN